MSEWEFDRESDLFKRRFKKYQKNHKSEITAVLNNLDKYMEAINAGTDPHKVQRGFIHPEPMGIIAIDQKGHAPNLRETRLYIYPEAETRTIYLITIGDKDTQDRRDIPEAKQFVEELLKERENG